ncbi:conserved hypothetical protein [Culex quinquefasciatus]|uniref:Uncharacterized protein n=1 Tax=Culex quinquefasciatus TaxID=7176 RepID=B0XLM5_CULQU|nr:conserved hypothetical protein [Culex quinquefasciatus]|eukprot:XP_001870547.1 conserved hypothetical protein [Culex quinquefasciatus]
MEDNFHEMFKTLRGFPILQVQQYLIQHNQVQSV